MPNSASSISASARSGEICRHVGPYRSDSRVTLVVFMRAGERFPNDAEGRSTRWTLLTDGSRSQTGS